MAKSDDLRSSLLRDRPGAKKLKEENLVKRRLALSLRALRKQKGLTQRFVAEHSGLGQPVISRLEAPTGPIPRWDTIAAYVKACGGQIGLCFDDDALPVTTSETALFETSVPVRCTAMT